MKKFALIGYPLGHSMSPFIHNELFKINGINADYKLIEILPDKLCESKSILEELDGFNVTIPHKTNIINLTDSLSQKAELFGAVNTVNVKSGALTGYNTDCVGFLRALKIEGIELKGRVLICGNGGVARMFAFECALAGAAVTLAVRESGVEKANKIKDEIKTKLETDIDIILLNEINGKYDLLINATPVGMFPNTEACIIDEKRITDFSNVFDAIYNPLETVLLKRAKENNVKGINGLSMLVLQAAAAQEIWLGVKFSEEDIRKVIAKTQEELLK